MRFGRYETLRELAAGGMGTVYLARAVGEGGFERLVALKVMHKHVADQPEFEAMFLDEARLAARIRHPNVVGTIDVQRAREGLFLVMEFVEGPSLSELQRHLTKHNEPLPMEIALRIAVDTLAGLHAAHELHGPDGLPLQLVHRDVSPPNILLGIDGVAKLTDFGVARAEARLGTTTGGQIKGKLSYMPPEQGVGDAIDRRADVYAVGVVLWEMLTQKRLFKAEHEGAVIAKILAGAETSPREVNPEVPEAIDAVCMKALALLPESRFSTAAEFADAIEDTAAAAGLRIAPVRRLASYLKGLGLEMTLTDEESKLTTKIVTPTSQMSAAAAVFSRPPIRSGRRVLRTASAVGVVLVGAAGAWWLLRTAEKSPEDTVETSAPVVAPSLPSAAPAAEPVPAVVPAQSAATAGASATASSSVAAAPSATTAPSTAPPTPRVGPRPHSSPPKPHDPSGFRPEDL